MKVDVLVLVEDIQHVCNFYPISLTTPLTYVIVGGFRVFEHVYLRSIKRLGYNNIEIMHVLREHLNINWRQIIPHLLAEDLLDVKIRDVYTTYRSFMDIIVKYDSAVILPANSIPREDELDKILSENIVKTKDLTITKVLELVDSYGGRVIRSLPDIIKYNSELMLETFSLLNLQDRSITLDSEVPSNCVVEKPHVLYKCEVRPFTIIRSGTVVYPNSVVGGELKNVIIDMFTHKEHYGYLGDCYVGRHVNFGAGTTVSNLKNTRGTVRYLRTDTGMEKLGPFIGDFVKTAIGTLLYCGKTVGPHSHVYGTVDTDVPPFVIYRNGKIEKLDKTRLIQFIDRWCRKYGKYIDINLEKLIVERLYDYVETLLEESAFNNLTLNFR